MENELLYNELYEKTQDCGRAQFVKLLMEKERENRELKSKLEASEKARKDGIDLIEKLRFEKWAITGTDIMEVMDILDIDKGEIKNL